MSYLSLQNLNTDQRSCLTIGNFDGVHLGHQALINKAREIAEAKKLNFVLVTFWPHPRTVLFPEKGHHPLTSRAERLRLLHEIGVANIIELPFTKEFGGLSAEDFVKNYLLPLNIQDLIIGHDFSLGKNRQGSFQLLRKLGEKWHFGVEQMPALTLDGETISSTRLRQYIRDGEIKKASCLLGRNYAIHGTVTHGCGRGKGLGFPTANLDNPDVLLPGDGVYATFASCQGKKYQAVTNIGVNPTFGGNKTRVESFLLEGEGNFYEEPLRLEFVDRLRSEKRFESPQQLTAQIAKDVKEARAILAKNDEKDCS